VIGFSKKVANMFGNLKSYLADVNDQSRQISETQDVQKAKRFSEREADRMIAKLRKNMPDGTKPFIEKLSSSENGIITNVK
jgi:phage portal protein BeeE